MDIDIKNVYGSFKFRVSAIIIKDNKILLTKSKCREGYCFPGGHVELGETTLEALSRECQEELNIVIDSANIFAILENIYTTGEEKTAQEVNYFYNVKTSSKIPDNHFELQEIDKGVAKRNIFDWVNLEQLGTMDLLPLKIRDSIISNQNEKILFNDERVNR